MEGMCDTCGKFGRLYTCVICGKRICNECYIPEKGVCITCIRGRQFK